MKYRNTKFLLRQAASRCPLKGLWGFLFTLLLPCAVSAQNEEVLPLQLWQNTANSAALTVDTLITRGYAEICGERTEGSYRRVQEGTSVNQLSFYTERSQPLGSFLYGYGSFRFSQGATQNRAWSDVMRSYDSSPFISGSSVPGRYDHQDIDLTARVSTTDFNGFRFGMGLDYRVGDLSRLRDPRSRSRLLDYRLSPSVAYTFGNNTIGLSSYYDRRKEKLPTLTTVQNNPNLYYYQMTGLDAVSGTIGGYTGFAREYVNHAFGAELGYGYNAQSFRTVNTISISRATDYIYEQYKREPGRYYTYKYGASSQNRIINDAAIHQFDLAVDFEQGYADEYRPQLVITIDSLNGFNSYRYDNLMTYKKRYQSEILNASLHYRLNFIGNGNVNGYVGMGANLRTVSQKHLLPQSTFDLRTLKLNAEFGKSMLKSRLWITAGLGYLFSLKNDMSLTSPDTDYAKSVLLVDADYYDANYVQGKLSVMYRFPLTIKKSTATFYVKGFGEYLSAQKSLDRSAFGVSIGILN